ncbi:MAG: tetratricopeptide repeat protein [Xanthobacteraceae bacterium]|nr:tetratricopeptide repeat protein [Xanthobacteraceae bacterium]
MSDIIREVDEELRRERLANIWKKYGGYIALAAFLLVAATAGWRGYEYYSRKQAEAASDRFVAAQKLAADATKIDEAIAAFNAIAADAPGAYKLLARFSTAAELGRKDAKQGAAAFDAIANDASVEPLMRELASIRGAVLAVDTADLAEMQKRLQPALADKSAYRHSAMELLALAHLRAGDQGAAQKLLLQLAFDPETPPGLRNRAQRLQAALFTNAPAKAEQKKAEEKKAEDKK